MTTNEPSTRTTSYVLQRWDPATGGYTRAPDGTYTALDTAVGDASSRRSAGTLEGRFRVLNLATGAVELEWLH